MLVIEADPEYRPPAPWERSCRNHITHGYHGDYQRKPQGLQLIWNRLWNQQGRTKRATVREREKRSWVTSSCRNDAFSFSEKRQRGWNVSAIMGWLVMPFCTDPRGWGCWAPPAGWSFWVPVKHLHSYWSDFSAPTATTSGILRHPHFASVLWLTTLICTNECELHNRSPSLHNKTTHSKANLLHGCCITASQFYLINRVLLLYFINGTTPVTLSLCVQWITHMWAGRESMTGSTICVMSFNTSYRRQPTSNKTW